MRKRRIKRAFEQTEYNVLPTVTLKTAGGFLQTQWAAVKSQLSDRTIAPQIKTLFSVIMAWIGRQD